MSQIFTVFIGLGSNLGNKEENIEKTLTLINENHKIILVSKLYASEPWGFESKSKFVNAVICIQTKNDPLSLFNNLKDIESKLGRKKTKIGEYEDRVIDLDILFYEKEIIENEIIKIPHKEIQNRKFVLEPLNEIASNFVHPILNKPIYQLLAECKDNTLLEQIVIK